MIPSVKVMIEKYVAAWNEESHEAFKMAFTECWAEEATYTDPNFELITGVEGIAGLAESSLEKFPERKFHVLTQPEHHHNVGRYTWTVNLPDGPREGFDYFEFNEEFKVTRIVSFF